MTEPRDPPRDDPAELRELRSRVEQLSVALEEACAQAVRLEALADEDPLTGLLNRRGFLRDLTRALAPDRATTRRRRSSWSLSMRSSRSTTATATAPATAP